MKIARATKVKTIKVDVVDQPVRLGYAYSIREGIRMAYKSGAKYVITMDADLSHEPENLPAIIDLLDKGFDLVVGSRYTAGGKIYNWSMKRRTLSHIGNWLYSLAGRSRIKDLTTGYVGYSRKSMKSMLALENTKKGYAYLTIVKLLLEKNNFKFTETPINFYDRVEGVSKMRFFIVMESIASLARLTWDSYSPKRYK